MKVKYLIKSLLCISFIFCFTTCRKYKTTTINGKLINMATGEGIANNKIALNAYSLSGGALPKKVESQTITSTDVDGNYSFIFDAYTTKNNKKEVSYGVEMVNDKYYTITSISDETTRTLPKKSVNLTSILNSSLVPVAHVNNLGETNLINLEVALAGSFIFQFFNLQNSDSMYFTCHNKFIEKYTIRIMEDNPSNSEYATHKYFIVSGENTLRRTIYKNGQINIIDTTIIVEPKDYQINFHY